MSRNCNDRSANIETTCGLLLLELQKIWDEVGENDAQRDKMLFEIEEECLEVYRRKVFEANKSRSELQGEIALAEAEIENICSELSEKPVRYEHKANKNLNEKIQIINPLLEEMRKRKAERKKQFAEVLDALKNISKDIFGSAKDNLYEMSMDGADLSLKRLEELQNQLRDLQIEKSNRLRQLLGLLDTLNSLCEVLGMDFKYILHEIHPTLDDSKESKDITDYTIEGLTAAIQSLRDVKIERMRRLQGLGTVLLELWNLMDTPIEEQQVFQDVTSSVFALEPAITEPNMLSMDLINHVEDEVVRLNQLKSSKVKELVLKKRLELEEICRNAHMVAQVFSATEYSNEAGVDPVHLLEEMELEIVKVKEEASSRKEILDKVEKWLTACEEESWLEEYNRDNNRYNAGRGAHLTLQRAEKARAAVNKIPALMEALTSKIKAWEKGRGIQFLYDGERLLSRLEQYSNLRKEKERERIRQRDQKKLQDQLIVEQEALFGAKPSPSNSGRKVSRTSVEFASNRKLSLGGAMLQNLKAEKTSACVHANKKVNCLNQNNYLSYQQNGGSGRRNSEIAGHLVKKDSSAKPRQTDSRLIRKPLSPIPLTMSSQANIANFLEEQKGLQDGTSETAAPCIKTPIRTPTKPVSGVGEENRTPKTLPTIVPTTPTTTSAPMLMSTPSTPYVSSSVKTARSVAERIEYSFEELRVGLTCPV
ncbi:hypothetical protein JCGZ_14518 [Jatropha curcas]|uniref:Uncharacterized protein n=1 Tax=Jatropha curcas TaxID=180498 RepID=A0A067JY14_JATCU|nr:65-kDa microtubule-associated protein 4 [Jatropha curcas]KDP28747.1 hypothetical protein JCGZ_14518 [Jatropha curcas]